jgi:hypothetical protein
MQRKNNEISWPDLEADLLYEWYYVSKTMSTIVYGDFGFFTFIELRNGINREAKESNKS